MQKKKPNRLVTSSFRQQELEGKSAREASRITTFGYSALEFYPLAARTSTRRASRSTAMCPIGGGGVAVLPLSVRLMYLLLCGSPSSLLDASVYEASIAPPTFF